MKPDEITQVSIFSDGTAFVYGVGDKALRMQKARVQVHPSAAGVVIGLLYEGDAEEVARIQDQPSAIAERLRQEANKGDESGLGYRYQPSPFRPHVKGEDERGRKAR